MEKAASRGEEMPMATDDPIRASDADREVVVATLREAFTAGRLTQDEFGERMSDAYAARTWGDLRQLTVDLPSQPLLGADVPARQLSPADGLPVHPARPEPETEPFEDEPQQPEVRRRSPVGLLIPVALWVLLISHGTIAPGLVFVFIVVCVLVSITASIRRR
jgi:Domain of unknown function (DUF1707)